MSTHCSKTFALLVSLLIIALVPLLVINEIFCQALLPYNFSDKLHVTLFGRGDHVSLHVTPP